MGAGADNAAAAANFNNSFSGLRDFLYKRAVQAPLLTEQVNQAKQATAQGANTLAQSDIATKQMQNEASLNAAQPDYDSIPDPHRQAAIDSATARGLNKNPGEPELADIPYPGSQEEAQQLGKYLGHDIPWVDDPAGRPATWTVPAHTIPKANYSQMYFAQLPPQAQQNIFNQYKAKAAHPDLISPDMVAQAHDRQIAATVLPPLNASTLAGHGLQMTEFGPQGPTYRLNPGQVTPIPGAEGESNSGFVLVDGKPVADPKLVAPEKMAEYIGNMSDLQNQQTKLNSVRDIVENHPEYLGKSFSNMAQIPPKGGTVLGKLGGYAGSFLGHPEQEAANTALSQKAISGILDTLGQIHIGRVTEKEWNGITGLTPTQDAPVSTWKTWLDATQNALNGKREGLESILGPRGLLGEGWKPTSTYVSPDTSGTTLPPVSPGASVQPLPAGAGDSTTPGTSDASSAKTLSTVQEVKALRSGQSYVWGPNGKTYIKN